MKESRFIHQNKAKWLSFESELKQKKKDPDKLSDLFVELTDDLSFAKTYYPNRLIRGYLNAIAQKIFLNFYKNKKNYWKDFVAFWAEDLPLIVYTARKEFLVAFLVFALATGIGILSCIQDPSYAEIVVGRGYVEMTNQNIANGDAMAVYKDGESFIDFLRIAWNNIRVAFYTFVLGATAGIGTLFILIKNGTMLGGFQFFFFDKGVFAYSLVTVWQHGTIEILSIIIAGAAGLTLAKGIIMPGTFPRFQAVQVATNNGLKIMLGLVPFFIVAALIESYITRLTDLPLLIRLGVIIASLMLMFGYWVYLPYRKAKEGFSPQKMQKILGFERPMEEKIESISLQKIKSMGEIFSDTFALFSQNLQRFVVFGIVIAILFGLAHVYYTHTEYNYYSIDRDFIDILMKFLEEVFLSFFSFFKYSNKSIIQVLNAVMLGVLFPLSMQNFRQLKQESATSFSTQENLWFWLKSFAYGAVVSIPLYGVFAFDSAWAYVFFPLLIPLLVFPYMAWLIDEKPIFTIVPYALKIWLSKLGSIFLTLVIFFLLFLCFMLIANVGISSIILDFIRMNINFSTKYLAFFEQFTSAFLGIFTFSFFFPMFIYGFALVYFSNKEYTEADYLIKRINQIKASEK